MTTQPCSMTEPEPPCARRPGRACPALRVQVTTLGGALSIGPKPAALAVTGKAQRLDEKEGPMLEEFKKFAMRGNVVDLAVGVIIGAAFGAIVASLVADIIMPVVGAVTGGLDFSNYFYQLTGAKGAATLADAKKNGAVLAYGNFITVALN